MIKKSNICVEGVNMDSPSKPLARGCVNTHADAKKLCGTGNVFLFFANGVGLGVSAQIRFGAASGARSGLVLGGSGRSGKFQFGFRVTSGTFQGSGLVPGWFWEVLHVRSGNSGGRFRKDPGGFGGSGVGSAGSGLVSLGPPKGLSTTSTIICLHQKRTFPGPVFFSVLGSSHAPFMLIAEINEARLLFPNGMC